MIQYITDGSVCLEAVLMLSLKSDFTDYYDDLFDVPQRVPHFVLNRYSRRVTRKEMLNYLDDIQHTLLYPYVVPHGQVRDMSGSPVVVVYEDDAAANGYGLSKMHYKEAEKLWPYKYSSTFVGKGGESIKHVVVGNYNYLIRQRSENSWKSTVGKTSTFVLDAWQDDYNDKFPMYVVTYVDTGEKIYAIKLNITPKLGRYINTPKDKVISTLRGWFDEHHYNG